MESRRHQRDTSNEGESNEQEIISKSIINGQVKYQMRSKYGNRKTTWLSIKSLTNKINKINQFQHNYNFSLNQRLNVVEKYIAERSREKIKHIERTNNLSKSQIKKQKRSDKPKYHEDDLKKPRIKYQPINTRSRSVNKTTEKQAQKNRRNISPALIAQINKKLLHKRQYEFSQQCQVVSDQSKQKNEKSKYIYIGSDKQGQVQEMHIRHRNEKQQQADDQLLEQQPSRRSEQNQYGPSDQNDNQDNYNAPRSR